MKRHRPLARLLVSAILVALPATPLLAVETGVSSKLGLSTYADRKDNVTLVVDSYAASLRESEAYIPIRIALGVVGKGRTIRFGVESFTLRDDKGNEVALASYQDIQRNYDKRVADDAILRERPMMLDSRFDTLSRLSSRFYPSPAGRGTRTNLIELAPGTWFQDVLYFPRPADGTRGVLTLRVRGRGMDNAIAVKFRVHEPGEGEQLQSDQVEGTE
jgi:hypothetical protein